MKIVGAVITRRKRHQFFLSFLINIFLNAVARMSLSRAMMSAFMCSISVETAWPLFVSLLHIAEASPLFAGTCCACLEKRTSVHLFFFFRAPSIVAHIFRQPETSDQLLIFSFRLQSQPLSI